MVTSNIQQPPPEQPPVVQQPLPGPQPVPQETQPAPEQPQPIAGASMSLELGVRPTISPTIEQAANTDIGDADTDELLADIAAGEQHSAAEEFASISQEHGDLSGNYDPYGNFARSPYNNNWSHGQGTETPAPTIEEAAYDVSSDAASDSMMNTANTENETLDSFEDALFEEDMDLLDPQERVEGGEQTNPAAAASAAAAGGGGPSLGADIISKFQNLAGGGKKPETTGATDQDGDGVPDDQDADRDGDGIIDIQDPDPNTPNTPGAGSPIPNIGDIPPASVPASDTPLFSQDEIPQQKKTGMFSGLFGGGGQQQQQQSAAVSKGMVDESGAGFTRNPASYSPRRGRGGQEQRATRR